jgi:hypothetical protein
MIELQSEKIIRFSPTVRFEPDPALSRRNRIQLAWRRRKLLRSGKAIDKRLLDKS